MSSETRAEKRGLSNADDETGPAAKKPKIEEKDEKGKEIVICKGARRYGDGRVQDLVCQFLQLPGVISEVIASYDYGLSPVVLSHSFTNWRGPSTNPATLDDAILLAVAYTAALVEFSAIETVARGHSYIRITRCDVTNSTDVLVVLGTTLDAVLGLAYVCYQSCIRTHSPVIYMEFDMGGNCDAFWLRSFDRFLKECERKPEIPARWK